MKSFLFLGFLSLSSVSGHDLFHRIASIPEASGISYCCDSDTLVVANDEGWYYEIGRDGTVLKKKRLGDYDLEGVICGDKHLLFAVEDKGLLEVSREDGRKKLIVPNPYYRNRKISLFGKKHGIEGITKDGNLIYLSRQAKKKRDSIVVALKMKGNRAKIVDVFKQKTADISGLDYHHGILYMVSDKKDLLLQYDLKKMKTVRKIKLPKAAQEGIAFDGEGCLYIADDDGYILKYSEASLELP